MDDAFAIIGYAFQGKSVPANPCLDASDANDDGVISISDPLAILKHLYGGTSLIAPFEQAGLDPTPDGMSEECEVKGVPNKPIQFAIIGDFGRDNDGEKGVADLVKSWDIDFVVTVGDNNYSLGEKKTIDKNIGKYYHPYIYPYKGSYKYPDGTPGGSKDGVNRFFPVLGNHDWNVCGDDKLPDCKDDLPSPYLDYFTLPGNERYYDFKKGSVHFFMIDSDSREKDGTSSDSVQADWLKDHMKASDLPFQFVFMHHPPYSSGEKHGSSEQMRWPYKAWGADLVFTGHEHNYERIYVEKEDLTYFVNGLGGSVANAYPFADTVSGSKIRYLKKNGAMKVTVDAHKAVIQFITSDWEVIDTYTLEK